jgi:hypothetical protein
LYPSEKGWYLINHSTDFHYPKCIWKTSRSLMLSPCV